jgi:hypothetical protein
MRRQRNGAAELRPDDRASKRAETLAAEFFRHVDLPEAEFLAARGQPRFDLWLELLSVERLAFERNHLVVDEAPHHVLQLPQLGRQIEYVVRFAGAGHVALPFAQRTK